MTRLRTKAASPRTRSTRFLILTRLKLSYVLKALTLWAKEFKYTARTPFLIDDEEDTGDRPLPLGADSKNTAYRIVSDLGL